MPSPKFIVGSASADADGQAARPLQEGKRWHLPCSPLLRESAAAGGSTEGALMSYRFISTRMHGIMDYLTAFTLPFVSRVMGWETPVRNMHDCVAGTTGFLAATTDFEPGLVKAIPVKAHLAI